MIAVALRTASSSSMIRMRATADPAVAGRAGRARTRRVRARLGGRAGRAGGLRGKRRQRGGDRLQELVGPERLLQAYDVRQLGDRLQLVERGSPGRAEQHARHGDHRKARITLAQRPDEGHAVDARHEKIGDHHVETALLEFAQAGLSAVRPDHVETIGPQGQRDGGAHGILVVDHENARHGATLRAGCRNVQIGTSAALRRKANITAGQ